MHLAPVLLASARRPATHINQVDREEAHWNTSHHTPVGGKHTACPVAGHNDDAHGHRSARLPQRRSAVAVPLPGVKLRGLFLRLMVIKAVAGLWFAVQMP